MDKYFFVTLIVIIHFRVSNCVLWLWHSNRLAKIYFLRNWKAKIKCSLEVWHTWWTSSSITIIFMIFLVFSIFWWRRILIIVRTGQERFQLNRWFSIDIDAFVKAVCFWIEWEIFKIICWNRRKRSLYDDQQLVELTMFVCFHKRVQIQIDQFIFKVIVEADISVWNEFSDREQLLFSIVHWRKYEN